MIFLFKICSSRMIVPHVVFFKWKSSPIDKLTLKLGTRPRNIFVNNINMKFWFYKNEIEFGLQIYHSANSNSTTGVTQN